MILVTFLIKIKISGPMQHMCMNSEYNVYAQVLNTIFMLFFVSGVVTLLQQF